MNQFEKLEEKISFEKVQERIQDIIFRMNSPEHLGRILEYAELQKKLEEKSRQWAWELLKSEIIEKAEKQV